MLFALPYLLIICLLFADVFLPIMAPPLNAALEPAAESTDTRPSAKEANPDLYTAIKSSYGDQHARDRLMKAGYEMDKELSDHRHQVWANKKNNELLMNVAGTHNLHDVITDVKLGVGKLGTTRRFKSAQRTLEKAKAKYDAAKTTITGHSLGGSIAERIAAKDDTVFSANPGKTVGEKARKGPGMVVRTGGDLVSFLGSGATKVRGGRLFQPLYSHAADRFKGKRIFI